MLNQIAVAIKTGSEVQNLRLEKLANTWMKSRPFPNVILVGDVDSPASDNILGIESFDMKEVTRSLLLNNMKIHNYSQSHIDKYINKLMKGGWEGDKDKNLPALWFLFNKFPYKRVYMLIDDDTYVFVENLLYNLQHNSVYNPFWNASFVKPAFGGNCFLFSKCLGYNNSIFTNGKRNPRFAHGGSGVLLNYAALRMMQPIVSECVQTLPLSCYAGDMQMAACLFMSNVPTPIRLNEMTGEHLSWPILGPDAKAHSKLWASDQRIISVHQLPDTEQTFLYEFESSTPYEDQTFRKLREHVLHSKLPLIPRHWWRNKSTKVE